MTTKKAKSPWIDQGGKSVNLASTVKSAFEQANSNWQVMLKRIKTEDGVLVEDHFATCRSDTGGALGVVGTRYTPLQNADAFAFFDHVMEKDSGVRMCAVGELEGGKKVFAIARGPVEAVIRDGHEVRRCYLLYSAHDGRGSVRTILLPLNDLCQNQLEFSQPGYDSSIYVKHTKHALNNLSIAEEILNDGATYFKRACEAFKYMESVQVDTNHLGDFLSHVFPAKYRIDKKTNIGNYVVSPAFEKVREEIVELFEGDAPGCAGKTRWDLFNAVAWYVDRTKKSKEGCRWANSMFGTGQVLRQKAFDYLSNKNN